MYCYYTMNHYNSMPFILLLLYILSEFATVAPLNETTQFIGELLSLMKGLLQEDFASAFNASVTQRWSGSKLEEAKRKGLI